jgi:hypothetical protein
MQINAQAQGLLAPDGFPDEGRIIARYGLHREDVGKL